MKELILRETDKEKEKYETEVKGHKGKPQDWRSTLAYIKGYFGKPLYENWEEGGK